MSEPVEKRIYLVMEGLYSDRHVERTFSTRAKADEFLNGHHDADVFQIEEFPLDVDDGLVVTATWSAKIDLHSGDLSRVEGPDCEIWPAAGGCKVRVAFSSRRATPELIMVRSPESADHAVKVAIEKRQEYLRTGTITEAP